MATIISFTAIPSDGIMLSEIDEFILILNEMKIELNKEKEKNPDNDYRIYISDESKIPEMNEK
jgi:hypothetical protein